MLLYGWMGERHHTLDFTGKEKEVAAGYDMDVAQVSCPLLY